MHLVLVRTSNDNESEEIASMHVSDLLSCRTMFQISEKAGRNILCDTLTSS